MPERETAEAVRLLALAGEGASCDCTPRLAGAKRHGFCRVAKLRRLRLKKLLAAGPQGEDHAVPRNCCAMCDVMPGTHRT